MLTSVDTSSIVNDLAIWGVHNLGVDRISAFSIVKSIAMIEWFFK